MKAILCLLLVSAALSYELNHDTELAQLNKVIQDFSDTQTGKMILELAQLHSEMQGPLDDLLATLQQLADELQRDLDRLEQDYTRRTNDHNRDVATLEGLIQSATFELSVSVDQIDNFVKPNLKNTQDRIDQISNNIKDNRDTVARENALRAKDKNSFLDRSNEISVAISAIDECLQLLAGLQNGNVAFSEKATLHRSLSLIAQRLEHASEYAPMIQALMQLAQNFSDQNALGQIIQMLRDLRKQLVDALNQESADEAERVGQFEARQKTLQADYLEFQRQVQQLTYTLVAYQNKLQREQENQAIKRQDLQNLQEQLDDENSSFADDTALYQELKAQCVKELNTARKALEFLQSAQFSTLMKQRMNNGPLAGR